jgi:hypothetical protein
MVDDTLSEDAGTVAPRDARKRYPRAPRVTFEVTQDVIQRACRAESVKPAP